MSALKLAMIALLGAALFTVNETAASAITNSPSIGTHETLKGKVLKAFAVSDGNAQFRAYVILWKGQEIVVSDPLAVSNYREGDTITVLAMRHPYPQGRKDYDLLAFQILEAPTSKLNSTIQVVPAQGQNNMVFFECRSNELFCVEKADLEAQVSRQLAKIPKGSFATNEFLQTLAENPVGNASYLVDPGMLLFTGILQLHPRPDVHGEGVADLDNRDGKFQNALRQLNPQRDSIVFLAREDSAAMCERARQIASAAGFGTCTKSLGKDKPIMISLEAGVSHTQGSE